MSMPGPIPTGLEVAESFPMPGATRDPPEVPPSPAPIEGSVTEPDMIEPDVGMPVLCPAALAGRRR